MRLLYILIAIISSASIVHATGADQFRSYLKRTIAYRSCSAPEVALIDSSLALGLSKLSAINPSLLNDRLNLNTGRRLVFNCSRNATNAGAMADTQNYSGQKYFMGIQVSKNALMRTAKINIAGVLASQTQEENAFSNNVLHKSTNIFHEFLHFLQFDNLPSELHNSNRIRGRWPTHAMTKQIAMNMFDVVYSCSIAAFADPEKNDDFFRRENLDLNDYALSCAAATVFSSAVVVKAEDLRFLNSETRVKGSVACLFDSHKLDGYSDGWLDWNKEDELRCRE